MQFIVFLNRSATSISPEKVANVEACTHRADEVRVDEFGQALCISYHYRNFLKHERVVSNATHLVCAKGSYFSKQQGTSLEDICLRQEVDRDLMGEFLIFSLNVRGTGRCLRPVMSLHQLFHYRDEQTDILSTDLALILSSVDKLSESKIGDIADAGFIEGAIFNEWGERRNPHATFIRRIQRIQTIDELRVESFRVTITRKSLQEHRKHPWLYDQYLKNRTYFYHSIIVSLKKNITQFFSLLDIRHMTLNLTGGLDSRTTLAVLAWFNKQKPFDLKLQTYGPDDHPDVVVAKMIANALDLPHTHHNGSELSFPRSIADYRRCFKMSLGDWNSNSYSAVEYRFINGLDRIHGQDNYKQCSDKAIYGLNRWGGGRMRCQDLFPILMTYETNQAALFYGAHDPEMGRYEYVENVIGAFCPELLSIPFVGYELPNVKVRAYKTRTESKRLPSINAQAYFDEALITESLTMIRPATKLERLVSASQLKPLSAIVNRVANTLSGQGAQSVLMLNTERKRRIAMDYASVYNLKVSELLGG